VLYGVANLPDIYVGTTSSTLSAISRTCMPASIGERIGHCRRGAFTYPRLLLVLCLPPAHPRLCPEDGGRDRLRPVACGHFVQ
jgi:hypothetical protein